MITDLINYFRDKKILILGFGREGISTYKTIRKFLKNQQICIADKKENLKDEFEFLKEDNNITYLNSENYLENLDDFDIIMKSPGISFVGIDTTSFYHKIKSQLELFLEFFDNYTIGITGTKGKSTTSSLIYTILKEQDVKCMLLGNIGVPVFECFNEINDDTVIVLEMSSHQLEYMEQSPNIAILLNVFEEHLDHYKSFQNYIDAKCNIYKYQNENDYFLYNADNEVLKNIEKPNENITYKVSINGDGDISLKGDNIYFKDEIIYNKNDKRNLIGDYNLNNIMFVMAVAKILELDINKARESINNFRGLEHRLEFVGKYNDILYYDNSIATIPAATIEAVKALGNVSSLIIGGMDRGIDYQPFVEYLNESNIENIICMPKTGHDIYEKISVKSKYKVDTLEEAVNIAKKVTEHGKSCLLSPAAASYGFFKNFEEKGRIFKELVKMGENTNV